MLLTLTIFFIIQVLSYKNNPYKYFNSEDIRSSVVKTVITDIKGDELKLYDLEDDLTTTMDLSPVTHNVHWFLLKYKRIDSFAYNKYFVHHFFKNRCCLQVQLGQIWGRTRWNGILLHTQTCRSRQWLLISPLNPCMIVRCTVYMAGENIPLL